VQLEEFDKRSVEYGLLISTAHYGGRYCDKEKKNEIRYNIKVVLGTQSVDKIMGQWDEGMEILMRGKKANLWDLESSGLLRVWL